MDILKQKLKDNTLEITFLKQAVVAQRMQGELDATPRTPWKNLTHSHICKYCNEVWSDRCDDCAYHVRDHGCPQYQSFRKMLAMLNNAVPKDDEAYVSRYNPRQLAKLRKDERRESGEVESKVYDKIAANELEIAALRAKLALGQ